MRPARVLATSVAACLALSLAACGPDRTTAQQPSATPGQVLTTATSPFAQPSLGPTITAQPEAPATTSSAAPQAVTDGVTPGTGLASYYAERVHWSACDANAAAVDFINLSGFQCAAVRVPLDYRHPAGRKISIGIARLPATGSHRIGTLLIDPGGPGSTGFEYLSNAKAAFPASVRARFDIVGFDPRGVGVSAGLNCLSVAQFDANVAAPVSPTTPAEVTSTVARDKLLADGCAKTAGWELPYIGTVYAARDMDLIRSAVGDAKLTYVGKSYGTQLGEVYADEFPTKIRALVLDGALPLGTGAAAQARAQGQGFAGDLSDFLADCVHHSTCPFSGSAAHARTQFDAFLSSVAVKSVGTSLGRPLAVGNAVNGIIQTLYNVGSWPALRAGLSQAIKGDGSLLLALSDSFAGRHLPQYAGVASSFPAISCMDTEATFTVAQVAAFAASWAVDAPLFGPLEAWGLLTCDGWVASKTPLPTRFTATGVPPIVSWARPATRPPRTTVPWSWPASCRAAGSSPTSATATRCTGTGSAAASTRPSTPTCSTSPCRGLASAAAEQGQEMVIDTHLLLSVSGQHPVSAGKHRLK